MESQYDQSNLNDLLHKLNKYQYLSEYCKDPEKMKVYNYKLNYYSKKLSEAGVNMGDVSNQQNKSEKTTQLAQAGGNTDEGNPDEGNVDVDPIVIDDDNEVPVPVSAPVPVPEPVQEGGSVDNADNSSVTANNTESVSAPTGGKIITVPGLSDIFSSSKTNYDGVDKTIQALLQG